MIFLENFYKTQTLSCDKLKNSSFVDPNPQATIFTELPSLIKYYLARWEHLNLFSSFRSKDFEISHPDQIKTGPEVEQATAFMNSPRKLLHSTHKDGIAPLQEIL